MSVKIVLARFAPSKNANLSKSANFRLARLTPLATNPSAQLYGGLVTMLSAPDYCFVLGLRRRPCRRNHFPSSAKSSGNEPVLGLDGEESYDRVHHGSRCVVQHQHLRGSCFRRVSDALMGIFMDRSNLPSADPSTVWLADLIEATEAVAASTEPCDPAIVEAFSHRLGVAHRCQTLVRTGRLGHGRTRKRRAFSNIVKLRRSPPRPPPKLIH